MTSSSYETAWLIYLLSSAGIIAILWRVTRRWPSVLRHLMRISATVLLLTPYISDADKQDYAPAFLISVFDLAFGSDHEQAANAAKPLLALLVAGLVVSLIYSFTQRKKRP